ncbi:MAG: class I SAM-dependent methyltransferase [Bacteroidota bacterium]
MSSSSINYDRLAGWYDRLASWVFGDLLLDAQREAVHMVEKGGDVLWIGGGSGSILPDVIQQEIGALTYVEASAEMLKRASQQLRKIDSNTPVAMIHGTEDDIPLQPYHTILSFFFLDQFPQVEMDRIWTVLDGHLKNGGQWIQVDFSDSEEERSWWHVPLIQFMYLFFKVTTGLRAHKLPDMEKGFRENGYALKECWSKGHGLIQIQVWQKYSADESTSI